MENENFENQILKGQEVVYAAKENGGKTEEMVGYFMQCNGHNHLNRYRDAIIFGNHCLALAIEVGDKQIEAKASCELCSAYFNLGQYDDAIDFANGCFTIAQENELFIECSKIKSCFILTRTCNEIEQYTDAIRYGMNYLELTDRNQDNDEKMIVYKVLTHAFGSQNQFDEAFRFATICLEMTKEKGDTETEMDVCYSLCRTHQSLVSFSNIVSENDDLETNAKDINNKYLEVISHGYKRCLELAKENDDINLATDSYIEFCISCNRLDDAFEYGREYLEIAMNCGEKQAAMRTCILLANAHSSLNEYDRVLLYCNKCLQIAENDGNEDAEMKMHLKLGYVKNILNDYDSAVDHGNKCVQKAKRKRDNEIELKAYLMMLKAFEKLNSMENVFCLASKAMKLTTKNNSSFEYTIFKIETFWYNAFHFMPFLSDSDSLETGLARSNQDVIRRIIYLRKTSVQHERDGQNDQVIVCLKNIFDLDIGECDAIKNVCCLNKMAQIYKSQNKDNEAIHYYKEALGYTATCTDEFVHFLCLLDIEELYFKRGEIEESIRLLDLGVQSAESFQANFPNATEKEKIASFNYLVKMHKKLAERWIFKKQHDSALLLLEQSRGRELLERLLIKYGVRSTVLASEKLRSYREIHSFVSRNNYTILYYFVGIKSVYRFIVNESELRLCTSSLTNCEKVIHDLIQKSYEEMNVGQVKCENRCVDSLIKCKDDAQHSRDGIEENTEQLRCASREPSEGDDESSMTCAMEQLYSKLIGQFSTDEEEVIIVPDGPLYGLPFAALRNPDTKVYLSDSKQIRLIPSISALCILRKSSVDNHSGALIIGNPLIRGSMKLKEETLELKELPFAEEEAKAIAKILNVEALTGAYATKPAVLHKLKEGVSVIHIAAHGLVGKSAIVLSASSEIWAKRVPKERDYLLTMKDVQQTQVQAPLVVLSCCHSGCGKIQAEGVLGMCRAFLASGARAVLASLWAIDDKATLEFMKLFYTHLAQGTESASKSLHLTMKDMKASPDYSEPKYWAPFFLMGDDVTIKPNN